MSKSETYKNAKHLISLDKLEEALVLLVEHFDNNQLLLQSARLNSLKSEVIRGGISFQEAQLERSRIRVAILSIAEECVLDYNSESKERISNKLLYLKDILEKRRSKLYAFFLFFMLFRPDIVRRIMIGFTAFILTIAGISYYFSTSESRIKNSDDLTNSRSKIEIISDQITIKTLQDSINVLSAENDSLQERINTLIGIINDPSISPIQTINAQIYNKKYNDLLKECEMLLSLIKSSGRFGNDKREIQVRLEKILSKHSLK